MKRTSWKVTVATITAGAVVLALCLTASEAAKRSRKSRVRDDDKKARDDDRPTSAIQVIMPKLSKSQKKEVNDIQADMRKRMEEIRLEAYDRIRRVLRTEQKRAWDDALEAEKKWQQKQREKQKGKRKRKRD